MAKVANYSAWDLQNLGILPENSADGLGSMREHCCSYIVSVFKNTAKNLVAGARA